jgi:hypothetical protein
MGTNTYGLHVSALEISVRDSRQDQGPRMNGKAMQLPGNADALRNITVNGNTMLPLYRHGDTLLVAEGAAAKFGDRVLAEGRAAGLVGGTLLHHNKELTVLIRGGNPNREVVIPASDLVFFGRIVWASQ